MRAQDVNLFDLLKENDRDTFTIPPYQRDYKWDKPYVIKLLEGLEFYKDLPVNSKPSNYYLGNIILKEININEWVIVDGQQRITTISLLSRVFYELLNEIINQLQKNRNEYEDLINALGEKKSVFKRVLIKGNKTSESNTQRFKIFFTKKNTKLIEALCLDEPITDLFAKEENRYQINLKLIYTWFKEKLNNIKVLEDKAYYLSDWYNDCLSKIAVAKIILDKKDEENVVFETINTAAKPLTDGELIKNWLYMKSQQNLDEDEKEKCGEFYSTCLEKEFNNENELTTFLNLFAEVKAGEPFQMTAKKVCKYTNIYDFYKKTYNQKFTKSDAEEIKEYLKFYKAITKRNDVSGVLFKYQLQQTFNTIYYLNQNNFNYEDECFYDEGFLKDSLDVINKYYYLKLFDNRPYKCAPTETSRLYKFLKNAEKLNDCKSLIDWNLWEATFNSLSSEKFILVNKDKIKKVLLYRTGKLELFKLLLWAINKFNDPTFDEWTEFSQNNNLTAEHIFPQKWDNQSEWISHIDDTSIINDFINYSGNVILLEKNKNSQCLNRSLEEKIKTYQRSRFQSTKDVAEILKDGWNLEVVEKINEYFLTNIFKLF